MQKIQIAAAALVGALLAACATPPAPVACPSCPVVAPCPTCPPVPAAPVPFSRSFLPAAWSELPGWSDDDVVQAWPAFLQSCRGMASRPQGAAW